MKKNTQRIFAGVLAVVVSIAMIGSAIIGYFVGGNPEAADMGANKAAESEYVSLKQSIDAMAQQASTDPENIPLQTALGNAYYNAAVRAETLEPEEMKGYFQKAVETYQKVLKTNKDINIMVDMASAAFYNGDYELAEKTFREALDLKPDFVNALFNYGVFLSQGKKDWQGALVQWQKALPLARNDQEKSQIQALIDMAQSQIGSGDTSNIANPNSKDSE